jgi:hypothetical protein
MNLRELTNDQDAILAQVESGDFSLDEVSDHLELLDDERKQKIENYLHVINRLTADVVVVTAELDRLNDIEKAKAKALKRTKDWLLMSMKDGEKHEFDLFKVSRVKGREVLSVTDDKKVPMKFMVNKPESWSVDKRLLLIEMKKGFTCAGAEISTGNPSLRIK